MNWAPMSALWAITVSQICCNYTPSLLRNRALHLRPLRLHLRHRDSSVIASSASNQSRTAFADLDFGLDNYLELVGQCNFPWLLSNRECCKRLKSCGSPPPSRIACLLAYTPTRLTVSTRFVYFQLSVAVYDKETGRPFADSPTTYIIEHKGRKFGFVGLVEHDWIATLGAVDPETIEYRDFVAEGDKLAKELRAQGCEYIIALTHSRLPNDELLANQSTEIDMVCGGHDHGG